MKIIIRWLDGDEDKINKIITKSVSKPQHAISSVSLWFIANLQSTKTLD